MALNWSSFLTDEGLNAQSDRWETPRTTAEQQQPQRLQQTGPTTTAPSGQGIVVTQGLAQGPQDFSPFVEGANQESYFSEAFYNDPGNYFLSDLEVLEPLSAVNLAGGSTSESSPENFNDVVDLTDPSVVPKFAGRPPVSSSATPATASRVLSAVSSRQQQQNQRNHDSPYNPAASVAEIQQHYATAFPSDPRSAAFVQDLTFPQGPSGSARTSNNALDTVPELQETDLTTKRTRKAGQSDSLSACWTSPLCPNHSKEGTPPNPSTCGGGCAPFLFSTEEPVLNSGIDSSLLSNHASKEPTPDGVVEIRSRLKRSESESNSEAPSGRVFSTSVSVAESTQPHLKTESSPESVEEAPSHISEDNKGKPRRRLPHNQVERKYRESLNTQLDSLRRVVPALQQGSRGCDGADIEDLPTPSKPSKAVVLASATAYIKQMEKDKKQLADENQLLRTRIKALQALVKCEDCSLMQYVMDLKIHNPA